VLEAEFIFVGASFSSEKNFYRLTFTPPLAGSSYRSFNLKCQIGLHHFEVLDETIETDISFAYTGARMTDVHETSCGPGGTHTRPCGDILSHMRPRGHDSSPVQRSTLSTNQEQARGSKGPQPRDKRIETMQTPP
jgi:hypothetical protein